MADLNRTEVGTTENFCFTERETEFLAVGYA